MRTLSRRAKTRVGLSLSGRGYRSTALEQSGILNRAPKDARWIGTLTFDPLPPGEGKKRSSALRETRTRPAMQRSPVRERLLGAAR
jgi:hypothetical protein